MWFRRTGVWLTFALGAHALAICGCEKMPWAPRPVDAYQGVIELDERVLAFTVSGRLLAVSVREGQWLQEGDELARLDDTLERLNRDARAAEARAARSQVDLLLAGAREEDIKSLREELTAARSSEALAMTEMERARTLAGRGISTAAQLDASRGVVDQATARRRNLEFRLAGLKSGARSQEIEAAQARAEAADTAVRAADERIAMHVLRTDQAVLVLDVHLDPNEFAPIGGPVVTVGDVRHPYVDVFIPEGRIGEVALGTKVKVRVDNTPEALDGEVTYLANRTEFTPRFVFSDRERPNLVIRVRVQINDPDAKLRAGVPAFVRVTEKATK
jgi:HlyD family secretion protein